MEPYLIIIIIAYLFVVSFGYWLDYLNLAYMKKYGSVIPPEFEGYIDQSLLSRTGDYNIEHTKFDFIHSIFNKAHRVLVWVKRRLEAEKHVIK